MTSEFQNSLRSTRWPITTSTWHRCVRACSIHDSLPIQQKYSLLCRPKHQPLPSTAPHVSDFPQKKMDSSDEDNSREKFLQMRQCVSGVQYTIWGGEKRKTADVVDQRWRQRIYRLNVTFQRRRGRDGRVFVLQQHWTVEGQLDSVDSLTLRQSRSDTFLILDEKMGRPEDRPLSQATLCGTIISMQQLQL